MNPRMKALSDAGVSVWLDDLSRKRMQDGSLQRLIDEYSVVGVTTNPTIFAAAFQDLSLYGDDLAAVKRMPTDDAIRQLMATDVKQACQQLRPIYDATGGYDGRVSIEVSPYLANDTQGTIAQAALLHQMVGEENVLIKIPATKAGLPAIRATIAAGISVNVTLIFSPDRYLEVINAYLDGLRDALAAGLDLSRIHSVASIFVSRVDTEVDKRLAALGTTEALQLRGKTAVANARACFQHYETNFEIEPTANDFKELTVHGANVQRALWASTGTKDPSLPDTFYVDQLITKPTVNTMPEKTLQAFADHGEVATDTVRDEVHDAMTLFFTDLPKVGVDVDDVMTVLENEGVHKFEASWDELVDSVSKAIEKA